MTALFYVNSPDDDWREFPKWADWYELPDWANFFLNLGEFIAAEPLFDERIVAAIALPTRAFAAVLVAAGIVKNCQSNPFAGNNSEHFKSLRNLPAKTPIKCLFKNRERDAFLLGCQEINGENFLIVQISSPREGNQKRFINEKLCHEIKLANENAPTNINDLSIRQKGRKIHQVNSFAREFLQNQTENSFEMQSSLDCLLIGNKKDLQQELNESTFACSTKKGEKAHGKLAEILRVKQFFITAQPSHCEFVSAEVRRKSLKRLLPENAPVTIFDGANGFLKLRDYCCASHWIILLDRTEGNFGAAIEQLNTNFSYCKSAEIPENFPDFPPEIEAMYFIETT